MSSPDKKHLVVMDLEERKAQIHLNIASGKKRIANLEYEKEELNNSFPQWDEEIKKIDADIKQILSRNDNKETK